MKWRLFVNPVAGSDSAPDLLPVINAGIRQRVDHLDIVMTVSAGDAQAIARRSVQEGYDHLIVAGGDGTLNEVVNGVAQVEGALARTVFGVIPLGTGNDFATAIGLVEDVTVAVDQLLDDSVPMAVDLGVVNGRHFINVSAGGFIAEVSESVTSELKSVAGKLAYLLGGAQVLLTHEPIGTRLVLPDQSLTLRLHAFAVCNSRQIGGGRLIAPYAAIDDGLLDVCAIEAMPIIEFVALLRRVSGGDHIQDERVHYFQVPALDLEFERTIKINTDGQVLDAPCANYQILPLATRVLTPVTRAGQ